MLRLPSCSSVLVLGTLILAGCSDTEKPAASSTPGETAKLPDIVTLTSAKASVVVHTRAFALEVKSAKGDTLLSTIHPRMPDIAGDDVDAYTPLGATHRTAYDGPALVEGWDHQVASDNGWRHASEVVSGVATATTLHLELTDPGDHSTQIKVDIVLDDDEVHIDAVASGGKPTGDESDEAPKGLNTMGMAFELPADEHFFGLGERFVTSDHRGQRYESWVEEGGVGGGEGKPISATNPFPNGPSMTHAPVPFLLSNRGYGMWLDTSFRTGFVLGADDQSAWRTWSFEPAFHAHVFVHDSPLDTVEHFTRLTGRAKLPAAWAFGPRRRVDHGAMIDGVPEYEALRTHGVPTTAIDDATHFLPIGSEIGREDELMQWTTDLHDLGFKSIGYYNSYVSVTDERAADLAAYARAHDLFVKLEDGTEFNTPMVSAGPQTVATIDMTNPEAVTWYHTILDRALALGYDGWMLDFGEYLPVNAKMHDGRTGWEAHNAFPVDYQKATFDYMRQVKGDDFMYFARAGYTGTQAFTPIVWSGDPSASFDDVKGLPANVRAGISAGISGMPFWGSDISGYTCLNDPPADKEVYLRWAEFGALSTDMHDENACAQKPPSAPDKWTLWSDTDTTEVYGRYARLHTRLNPYLYAQAKHATETGMPVMRHPMLLHPTEPGALASEFDFYFGTALYVAPVVRRGEMSRELWLPPGRWIDWWTMSSLEGGTMVTRDAPLDVLPLFLRSGQIVALFDESIETLAPETRDDVISAGDVAGVLDVKVAIDATANAAESTLVDGTTLSAHLASGAVALPGGITEAVDESDLATCNSCGRIDTIEGGVTRIRVSTSKEPEGTLEAGGLSLTHGGTTTRIRWEVYVIEG